MDQRHLSHESLSSADPVTPSNSSTATREARYSHAAIASNVALAMASIHAPNRAEVIIVA